VDISHHKQAEARQQLLINELNHRVKNTLATVQSIASHTHRGAASPEAFRKTFDARLMALSKAHNLLTSRHWEGAGLQAILQQELAAHRGAGEPSIALTGEEITLGPRAALTLAMVFHELATNAAKYGALSAAAGDLTVSWTLKGEPPHRRLELVWIETGGPRVDPPRRRGFGSRLIERSITGELRGRIRVDYRPKGLSCLIEIPLSECSRLD
jgi:two-component sensor histidine kinase